MIRWKRVRWVLAAAAVGALVFLGLFFGRLFTPPPTVWETVHPLKEVDPQVRISFPAKGKTQRWWLVRKGGPALDVEVDGPEEIYVELRSLLPPKTSAEGEFVSEVLLDGKVVDWEDFEAVPQPDVVYEDYVVCDKDRVKVAVPSGKHILQFRLLASTADKVLVRFRRAQTEDIEDDQPDKI